MKAETADKTRVAYRTIGSGHREVVLVHGWMMSGALYDELVAALDTTDLKLVVLDLRGTGQSDRPDSGYSLQQFADDVWTVIEHAGLKRPVVVGHSMGGQITQFVAASRPDAVSGLILINPVPATGLPLGEETAALFRSSAGDAGKQAAILDMACRQLSPESKNHLLRIAADVSPACIVESLGAWTAVGSDTHLAAISAPALVVASDDDFLPVPLLREQVVTKIKGSRLARIVGPGHYTLVEQPAATAALIEAFLAGLG
ncbi:MAG: alpha/beta hydrolase [Nannocystaceae bacterium]|nr:alpha/beta hydrolase [Nannocystaceae bacterium]